MTGTEAKVDRPAAQSTGGEIWSRRHLEALLAELLELRAGLLRSEKEFAPRLAHYTAHRCSARNLIHYLALRGHDIHPLQEKLAAVGLSSLGRTESHVLAGIEAVLQVLHALVLRDA